MGNWKYFFVNCDNKIFGNSSVEFLLNAVSLFCLQEFELYLLKILFCRGEEQNICEDFLLAENDV